MSRFQTDLDSTMTGAVGTPGFMPPEVMMNCWVQYDGSAWGESGVGVRVGADAFVQLAN